MEGLITADGGRVLKSGVLAFGALVWAAPLFAQVSDPLAPLPVEAVPQQRPATEFPPTVTQDPSGSGQARPQPAVATQAISSARSVPVPTDWRGVFDAIDAGQWASAQAGIAALPHDLLTPVAKAELYTAKGSPIVDLASLQALLAEAPEIPEADQIASLAVKRGATTPLMIVPEKPIYNIGSAPIRYKA